MINALKTFETEAKNKKNRKKINIKNKTKIILKKQINIQKNTFYCLLNDANIVFYRQKVECISLDVHNQSGMATCSM